MWSSKCPQQATHVLLIIYFNIDFTIQALLGYKLGENDLKINDEKTKEIRHLIMGRGNDDESGIKLVKRFCTQGWVAMVAILMTNLGLTKLNRGFKCSTLVW